MNLLKLKINRHGSYKSQMPIILTKSEHSLTDETRNMWNKKFILWQSSYRHVIEEEREKHVLVKENHIEDKFGVSVFLGLYHKTP